MGYEEFRRAMTTGYAFAEEVSNLDVALRMMYAELGQAPTESDMPKYRAAFWSGFHEGRMHEREHMITVMADRIKSAPSRSRRI